MGPDQNGVPSFVIYISTIQYMTIVIEEGGTDEILGKTEEQLTNLVVVLRLELLPRPLDALVKAQGLVLDEVGSDLEELGSLA